METLKQKHDQLYKENFTLYILIFIILIIVLILVIIGFSKLTSKIRKNRREGYVSPPNFKKTTEQRQNLEGQTEQDILKGMPVAISNQFDKQMNSIQDSFNTIEQSGTATTRNVANQTTFNTIEGIVTQNLATKGYMNEREAKQKEAALLYVWSGPDGRSDEIPDTYDSIIFNPYTGPSFASGQSGLYAGIQELENRADRVQNVQQRGVEYKNKQWINGLKEQQNTIFNELKRTVDQQQDQV